MMFMLAGSQPATAAAEFGEVVSLNDEQGFQRQQVVSPPKALCCVRPTDDLAEVVVAELGKRQILLRKMSPSRWQER